MASDLLLIQSPVHSLMLSLREFTMQRRLPPEPKATPILLLASVKPMLWQTNFQALQLMCLGAPLTESSESPLELLFPIETCSCLLQSLQTLVATILTPQEKEEFCAGNQPDSSSCPARQSRIHSPCVQVVVCTLVLAHDPTSKDRTSPASSHKRLWPLHERLIPGDSLLLIPWLPILCVSQF